MSEPNQQKRTPKAPKTIASTLAAGKVNLLDILTEYEVAKASGAQERLQSVFILDDNEPPKIQFPLPLHQQQLLRDLLQMMKNLKNPLKSLKRAAFKALYSLYLNHYEQSLLIVMITICFRCSQGMRTLEPVLRPSATDPQTS